MDEKKLHPLVRQMARDLMDARRGLPLSGAVAAINYKMANIASQLHITIDTKSGYKPTPANIYSLTLMSSGSGKNASLGLLDRYYFGEAFNYIRDTIYPIYKKKAMKELEDAGNDRDIHTWTQSLSNATVSGMYAYAESYSLCGFGSLNIEIDEIGNAVTSKAELFEQLLTPYDNGDFMPVAKRTDTNSMDIQGVPVNVYSFGNKVRLMNGDNVERAFIELIDEGYGRRFIFVDDNSKPISKTPEEILAEMDKSEEIRVTRAKDREYIKSLLSVTSFNKVLTMDRDAMLYYATIKSESDQYISNKKGLHPAVQADISERNFKTVKLAGVYAFFDGKDSVYKEHMEQAYEVIKESSEVLASLREIRPTHHRLLDALLMEDKPVTQQTMLAYPFIPSGWTKKIVEYIELAKQLAQDKDFEWDETTRNGVTYYQVIDIPI